MSADPRVAVSRLNHAIVIGLYGFDFATENYRYEPSLDAIDDRPIRREVHFLTAAEWRALREGE